MSRVSPRYLALWIGCVCVLLFSLAAPAIAAAAPARSAVSTVPSANCPPSGCPGTWYGADLSYKFAVALNAFPQQNGNWCGIADIELLEIYDYLKAGQNPPYTQQNIYDYLNSINSPWGPATYHHGGPGPYVSADIAADGGTDPAAVSQGLYAETPANFYFHNYIYRTSATQATYQFASDYGPFAGVNDPIIVAIKGGLHLFVISGVWANEDPSYGYSNLVVYYVNTSDPWLNASNQGFQGQPKYYNDYQSQAWALSDWTSLTKFWGQGYNIYNNYDPDPSTTGSSYYNPPFPGGYNTHWNGYYVTIEQDFITWYGPYYALDQGGNLAPHN